MAESILIDGRTRFLGSAGTTGSSTFKVFLEYEPWSYNSTTITMGYRHGITVTQGNFKGSELKRDSWCEGVSLGYDTGDKYYTGWSSFEMPYGSTDAYSTWVAAYTRTSTLTEIVSTLDSSEQVALAPTAPPPPTNVKATLTNNTVKLTWTNNPDSIVGYGNLIIERSDGSAYAQIATIGEDATSYTDSTIQDGKTYTYRVRVYRGNQVSGASSTITTKPQAPTGVSGVRAASGKSIQLTITGNTTTAASVVVQGSTDGTTWADAATITTASLTAPVITPNSGYEQAYWRVAWTNTSGTSTYAKTANKVIALCKPNAPTLVYPPQGATIDCTKDLTLKWLHNPLDSTAQTAATIVCNGTTYTTTTAQELTIPANTFKADATISWTVKTKGTYNGYSDATKGSFLTSTPPAADLTVTQGGKALDDGKFTELPIGYNVGTVSGFRDLTAALCSASGELLYSEASTSTSGEITASEFVPTNGNTYTLAVTVYGTNGLSTTLSATITADYTPPALPVLFIINDDDTGYVTLTISQEEGGKDDDTFSLVRVTDDGSKTLITGAARGEGLVDKYAPLNTEYTYKVTAQASSGAASTVEITNTLECNNLLVYYGTDGIAKCRLNVDTSWGMSKPNRELVYYDGRPDPVVYDDAAIEHTYSASSVLLTDSDDIRTFKRIITDAGGVGILKTFNGEVFHACFDLSGKPNNTAPAIYGSVELSITRIDGDAL